MRKLGGTLTIIVTSILFVIPHIQYDISILLLVLFPNALILGLCRLKTKSLTIPIILHCANNIFTHCYRYLELMHVFKYFFCYSFKIDLE